MMIFKKNEEEKLKIVYVLNQLNSLVMETVSERNILVEFSIEFNTHS